MLKEGKFTKKKTKSGKMAKIEEQEEIDVTYDDKIEKKEFDAEDATVTDRWSRYIGAMGIEAVKKQSKAVVLISGIDSLGLEIAKNLVLSGVKELIIADSKNLEMKEILGNFYADEKQIGQNRAKVVLKKLQ